MSQEEVDVLIGKKIEKSRRFQQEANQLIQTLPSVAIQRYYYSVFHAILALLAAHRLRPKTHKGVLSEFRRYYIRTGRFSSDDGKLITKLFQWRTEIDYEDDDTFDVSDVEMIQGPTEDLLDRILFEAAANIS